MMNYWQSLNTKQRWLVCAGGIGLFLLLIYLCVLLPIKYQVKQMQNEISDKKELIAWVNQNQDELQHLRKLQPIIKKQSSQTLLTLIEQSVNKKPISASKADLQQLQSNEVQVIFNQISFDALIIWIDHLWQESGILLQQISINPADKLGYVKVTAVLSKAI